MLVKASIAGAIVTSGLEHPCVVEPVRVLAGQGYRTVTLPVTRAGVVEVAELPDDARLVSVMLANHETGAIQPVAELALQVPAVPVHCDAAAAVGKIPVSFHQLGVAALTLSAHKFHGPPGMYCAMCAFTRYGPLGLKSTNASRIFALPSRNAFTSVPCSTMPASSLSMMV